MARNWRSGNKYGAKKTWVDDIKFDSKREANRYIYLKNAVAAGEISDLELQPRYNLIINDRPVLLRSKGYPNGRKCYYKADFRYKDADGITIIEDVKGMDTPAAKLKRSVVECIYGIRIDLT